MSQCFTRILWLCAQLINAILAYIVVGEEKHVGTQDPARGTSKIRLSSSIKQYLADWGYPWSETGGVICVDPCRY